ncbi:MAG: LPS export ABC transporter periplasmic protein LptC [Alphaproteobacteria bacterium]|nr:LPS export ABC transporter periplasmic protein LptC [Alphaproteobacteria bacterium]
MRGRKQIIERAAGYTRIVVVGRGLLWLMITGMIAVLVYMAADNGTGDGARLVFSQIKQMGDIQNIMKNPYYHGLDKDNMPYSVTATKAVQKDAETVLLEDIKADMDTKDGKWLALHAGAGEMKTEAKTLMLTKNVDMFYDGGYEFRSERAFVDIGKGTASGDTPVTGQGPMGTLRANRFSVFGRGEVIMFEGAVKVEIYRE